MNNPFYVQVAQKPDMSRMQGQLMQGLQMYDQNKKAEAEKQEKEEIRAAGKAAWESKDPAKMQEFNLQHPEYAEQLNKSMGITDDFKKKQAVDFSKRILTAPPEQRAELFRQRAEMLKSQGRPYQDTLALASQSPEKQNEITTQYLALNDNEAYKNYVDSTGIKAPEYSNIKETQSGRLMGLNKSTGKYELVSTPEAVAAKKPLVNIVNEAESKGLTEEQKSLAKGRAGRYDTLIQKANAAEDTIRNVDIIDAIDVNSGAFEPAKQWVAKWGEGLGFDTSGIANVSGGEALQAQVSRLVNKALSEQKGPQTDQDAVRAMNTYQKLGNTPEANKFAGQVMKSMAYRDIEKANFFEDYAYNNNGTTRGARKAWNSYNRDVPTLSRNRLTSAGLPVFYYQFKKDMKRKNPKATDKQIEDIWKEWDKKQ